MSREQFLKGRVAMVTGGLSGMGRAMALAFASAGADLSLGSLMEDTNKEEVNGEIVHKPGDEDRQQIQEICDDLGVQVLFQHLDVCSTQSVKEFYQKTIEKYSKVDILANAAGITAEQCVVGHSEELWNQVIDVNLNGTFRCIRECLQEMIEQKWGRIINIASTAASVGAVTSGAYCASKSGVVALTRCVALEGAAHGVTCNSISPGWVNTNFGKKWMKDIEKTVNSESGLSYIEEVKSQNPQNRIIQAEEIGALALYLCRDESLGVTMQDLTVSAGSLW